MVEKHDFGNSFLYRITDGETSVDLVPLGASVRAIRVPDRSGKLTDVCLGYDSPEQYRTTGGSLGAVVGPYANRIGGAAFTLNGTVFHLTANEGANCLHSGKTGFRRSEWELSPAGEYSVLCRICAADGEDGFPGNRTAEVSYTWRDGRLTLNYRAVSDADTIINLTNHTYFNLGGHDSGRVDKHFLMIQADRYTVNGPGNIPTGEILPVDGTPLDLRSGAVLGDRLRDPFLKPGNGFDNNLVLTGKMPAARLYCPETGIAMEMTTSMEGVQVFSAGTLSPRPGKGGAAYGPDCGVCLETQHFPDAVNHANFPSPVLRAGEEFRSETAYRFFVK